MKILYLGEISSGQTSLMRMRAFQRLGHTVVGLNTIKPWRESGWLRRQIQRRLCRGSIVDRINSEVLEAGEQFRPDIVWAEKQEFIRSETLRQLKKSGARLIHFTPDPYFYLPWKRTPLMDEAFHFFDVLVYCKTYERADYESLHKQLIYMPLGYCDEIHRPIPSSDTRWTCDVGFLGGWDPLREATLRQVANTGVNLKIWGGYWDFLKDGKWTLRRKLILDQLAGTAPYKIHCDPVLSPTLQGGEVYGDDYARALTGSRISVGFLRKAWPDQHTTRTFEIPACGSMLLADRTDEHQQFFEEGIEAEFFSSADELVEKIKFYARNAAKRDAVAKAGFERCKLSGYSYRVRLERVLKELT